MSLSRIGFGYDVHQLVPGRPFMLGGIDLEYSKGALGHSDADVLIHAICDALLGAANLQDIGFHFPDTSEQYKNFDSKLLLSKTMELIHTAGWEVGNIDSTVCLEKPKIGARVEEMKMAIAKAGSFEIDQISIKATTNEKMGFVGREEGVCAYAVVLLEKRGI